MLLEHKTAVVYGAGGSIGAAVARAFAREGASLFLAGRTLARVEAVAGAIRADGGRAEAAQVDALDERQVDTFIDAVAEKALGIDICFNLVSYGGRQAPLLEVSTAEFLEPITTVTQTQFLTTRAAARHMVGRGKGGVILFFGGSGPHTLPGLGGFKVALDALEGLRRQWACELGRYGIRLVTLKTGGVPESLPASFAGRNQIVAGIEKASLLGRAATFLDVGHVAAFVASDLARTMTAADVNISCGAIMD
jgi:3-oxoacyl-[acyl-carrier protein] reductase